MASYAGSPQIAVRVPGSNKCSRHYGQEVVFYCKNCDNLLCAECVIQDWQGHVFEGISLAMPASKRNLQDFITKAELTEIPNIQGKLKAADSDITKNKHHFKNQIKKIRKQNEAIKKELDKLTETFVKTYHGMEQQNYDELLNYKMDLQNRIDKLASQIQDVKGALQSGNDILVFDLSHVIQSKFEDLPKPVYSTLEYTPAKFSVQELELLIGKFNTNIQNESLNQAGNWKVKSMFTPYTGYGVKSIHAAEARGQVWLSFYNSNNDKTVTKMLLTDQTGQIKQTLDLDVRVHDFCLSPATGDIWFCSTQTSSVREVKEGQSIIRFTTSSGPWSICVTKDDYVIIGHPRQVVKYTQEGQVICRTSRGTPPVVRTPYHLSECRLTSNLAVVDLDMQEYGGNDKPYVSILDDQLQLLYTYNGEIHGQQSPSRPFNPFAVQYTATGELVVTDRNNMTVVLVTGSGRYLRTLCTNSKSKPQACCVDNDVIWVSLRDESVQVLECL